jgi:hypothetical protein
MPAYRSRELMELWASQAPKGSSDLAALIDRPLRLIKDEDATATAHQLDVTRAAALDAFSGKLSWEEAFARYKRNLTE